MKTYKEDINLLYEMLGRICLSSCFMDIDDQDKVADLVEEIIEIFKSYESKEEN